MAVAHRAYREILEALDRDPAAAGLPAEVGGKELRRAIRSAARSVLPNATETKIVVTANARAWRHFLDVRGSIAGDEEMRRVAAAVLAIVAREAPGLFADFEVRTMPDGSPLVAHRESGGLLMVSSRAIICAGDLMIEHIVRAEVMPADDTTLVLDAASGARWRFGTESRPLPGPARRCATAGRLLRPGDHTKVVAELHRHGLSADDLLEILGPTDSLMCVLAGAHHRSVYLRSSIGKAEAQVLAARCRGESPLILCGSRHTALRAAFVDLARTAAGRALVFSPSYTVFEYTAEELCSLLRHARLTAFNQQEADHACRLLKLRDVEALAAATPGLLIVTLGPRGAQVWGPGLHLELPSVARSPRVAVGAGDAFSLGSSTSGWPDSRLKRQPGCATMAAFVVESDRYRVEVSESSIQRRLVEIGW